MDNLWHGQVQFKNWNPVSIQSLRLPRTPFYPVTYFGWNTFQKVLRKRH